MRGTLCAKSACENLESDNLHHHQTELEHHWANILRIYTSFTHSVVFVVRDNDIGRVPIINKCAEGVCCCCLCGWQWCVGGGWWWLHTCVTTMSVSQNDSRNAITNEMTLHCREWYAVWLFFCWFFSLSVRVRLNLDLRRMYVCMYLGLTDISFWESS